MVDHRQGVSDSTVAWTHLGPLPRFVGLRLLLPPRALPAEPLGAAGVPPPRAPRLPACP